MKYLVTAIGSMSAEAVIQGVSRSPGAEVVGCNSSPREWVSASRLVQRFYQVPLVRDEFDYLAGIMDICRREGIERIVPLTDVEVDVLSVHRHLFEACGILVCLPCAAAIEKARDKLTVHDVFSDHSRICVIPTAALHDDKGAAFSYPLLIKPRRGRSSEGQIYIPDADAMQFWKARLEKEERYLVQPYCSGQVIVVDVVRQPGGGRMVAIAREELLRTSNGAGLAVRIWGEHMCSALAMEVAAVLDLHGCVNVEFLIHGEKVLLMDVNPRFSAGVAFSLMSGYDMVVNHLRCFSGVEIEGCNHPILDGVYTRGYTEYSL